MFETIREYASAAAESTEEAGARIGSTVKEFYSQHEAAVDMTVGGAVYVAGATAVVTGKSAATVLVGAVGLVAGTYFFTIGLAKGLQDRIAQ